MGITQENKEPQTIQETIQVVRLECPSAEWPQGTQSSGVQSSEQVQVYVSVIQ